MEVITQRIGGGVLIGLIVFVISCVTKLSNHKPEIDQWQAATLGYLANECEDYLGYAESLKSPEAPKSNYGSNDIDSIVQGIISFRHTYFPEVSRILGREGVEDIVVYEHYSNGELRLKVLWDDEEIVVGKLPLDIAQNDIALSLKRHDEGVANFKVDPEEMDCIALKNGAFPSGFVFLSQKIRNKWEIKYLKLY